MEMITFTVGIFDESLSNEDICCGVTAAMDISV